MVKVDLSIPTLAVLISGLYCAEHNVDAMAIPSSVWIAIAEKLEWFLDDWDYEVISFEDWVYTHLVILPKILLEEGEIEEMQKTTLYWEYPNGNMILIISMDIKPINESDDNGKS